MNEIQHLKFLQYVMSMSNKDVKNLSEEKLMIVLFLYFFFPPRIVLTLSDLRVSLECDDCEFS